MGIPRLNLRNRNGFGKLRSSRECDAFYSMYFREQGQGGSMNDSYSILIWLTLVCAASVSSAEDQLELVTQFQGGRHWVDAETAPPRTPEETLQSFEVEPGARVELFAAEPLVKDPVAIAFDEQGRMFVAEYGDYPVGPAEGDKNLSRIVLLEDTDDDGKADRRTVFADDLKFAHNLMPYRGGLLVGAQTDILFLQDTDGDNVADRREVLFSGFKAAHPQMQIGNPRWGMDNWVYFNYGPGKITRTSDGATVDMPRSEFRIHGVTKEFGPAGGLGQYGNTIDRWGHRFFCTNRNPIMTTAMTNGDVTRNRYRRSFSAQYDVAPSGGDARVFPLIAMKSNYLSHAGTHTAACGTTAYLGDRFGGDYLESVFVCEPIGHLVTRTIVSRNGSTLSAERARPKADFLASTDPWFRPSSLANGPDGSLYLADMYRLWVEHPKFLPDDVAAKLDWRAGEDRGRIWRIVPDSEEAAQPEFSAPQTDADLVALIESSNGWRRFLGQRLIVERQQQKLAGPLREVLKNSPRPESRLHALWTLEGLNQLESDDLQFALHDAHPEVRIAGLQLYAARSVDAPKLLDDIIPLVSDDHPGVRYQLLLSLAESESVNARRALAEVVSRDGAEKFVRHAFLSGAAESSTLYLSQLLNREEFTDKSAEWKRELVSELAQIVGRRGDAEDVAAVLKMLGNGERQPQWLQFAAMAGLADGLALGRHAEFPTFTALLQNPPAGCEVACEQLRTVLDAAATIALDSSLNADRRLAALELVAREKSDETQRVLFELLEPSEPIALRSAALEWLSRFSESEVAEKIAARWRSFSPALQSQAVAVLLQRPAQTIVLLQQMQEKQIPSSVVDLDQRVRLLKHRDEAVRKLASQLYGEAVSANRKEVIASYRSCLETQGDVNRGRALFEKHCQKCHRRHGVGEDLGPDISDLANRSAEAVLYDILDPNRKVEPRFAEYVVVTASGLLHHGLMVSESETAIVLAQPGGKTVEIQRSDVDDVQNTGKSLMPEGMEKEMDPAAMADLLRFLQN